MTSLPACPGCSAPVFAQNARGTNYECTKGDCDVGGELRFCERGGHYAPADDVTLGTLAHESYCRVCGPAPDAETEWRNEMAEADDDRRSES